MQSLKKIREQLGLSQKQFSRLLGISSGLVAMVEIGRRSLPADAIRVVTELANRVPLLPSFDPEAPLPGDESIQTSLEKEIRVLTRQLHQNQFLLDGYLEKMEKLQPLAALSTLPEAEPIWPSGSIEKEEWNLLQRKNNKKISALTKAIIFLKISIAGLDAEIKTAEKQIGG